MLENDTVQVRPGVVRGPELRSRGAGTQHLQDSKGPRGDSWGEDLVLRIQASLSYRSNSYRFSWVFDIYYYIVYIRLWYWRRLLREPWTARRSSLSILKEISPKYSLEGLILKLKLQTFGHLMPRTDSFEKTLMLGKIEGRRRRGWQSMRWLEASPTQWTWVWSISGRWWKTGKPGMLQSLGLQRVGQDWATEQQKQTQWVQDSDAWSHRLPSCCLAHLWTNSLRYSNPFEQYQNL